MKIIYGNIAGIKHAKDIENVCIEQKDSSNELLLKYINMFKQMDVSALNGVIDPKKPIMLLTIMKKIAEGSKYENGVLFSSYLEKDYITTWYRYVSADCTFKPDAKESFKLLMSEPFCNKTNFIIGKFDADLINIMYNDDSRKTLEDTLIEMISDRKQIEEPKHIDDIPKELLSPLSVQLGVLSNMKLATHNGYKAPHKPVLLVSFIILIEKGIIFKNKFFLDKTLIEIFILVWDTYVKRKGHFGCAPGIPFHHMDKSIGIINENVSPHQMILNDTLFVLLGNTATRDVIKKHLIGMINSKQ